MQQESTSLLVSYSKAKTKVVFVQRGSKAKPCKEGRKKMQVFFILFWTKSLETEWVYESLIKKSEKLEMQKKNTCKCSTPVQ